MLQSEQKQHAVYKTRRLYHVIQKTVLLKNRVSGGLPVFCEGFRDLLWRNEINVSSSNSNRIGTVLKPRI